MEGRKERREGGRDGGRKQEKILSVTRRDNNLGGDAAFLPSFLPPTDSAAAAESEIRHPRHVQQLGATGNEIHCLPRSPRWPLEAPISPLADAISPKDGSFSILVLSESCVKLSALLLYSGIGYDEVSK